VAALDAAIHEKPRASNMLLHGRVKPGHDNGSRTLSFTRSNAGMRRRPRSEVLRDVSLGPSLRGASHETVKTSAASQNRKMQNPVAKYLSARFPCYTSYLPQCISCSG
jgi:hypothetical protein